MRKKKKDNVYGFFPSQEPLLNYLNLEWRPFLKRKQIVTKPAKYLGHLLNMTVIQYLGGLITSIPVIITSRNGIKFISPSGKPLAFLRYDSEPRYSSLAYLYTSLEKQPLTMLQNLSYLSCSCSFFSLRNIAISSQVNQLSLRRTSLPS